MDVLNVETEATERIRQCAVSSYPRETIGVLGGSRNVVRVALPLRNHAKRPGVTLVRRADLVAAEAELARRGLARIGTFHSHPDREAVPSGHDLRTMRRGLIELIVPVRSGSAGWPRAWRLDDDGEITELLWPG